MREFNDLSNEEQKELIRKYYSGVSSTKKLIEEYGVNATTSNLYKKFPPEICQEKCCVCGTNLVLDRVSKTYATQRCNKSKLYCPVCKHKPYDSSCRCPFCREMIKVNEQALRDKIIRTYDKEYQKVVFEDLSFEEKVYLGAFVRALVKEDLYRVQPYVDSRKTLAPIEDLIYDIYKVLIRKQILVVDYNSPIDAFDTSSDDFPTVYYIYMVSYNLNLEYPENKQLFYKDIISPSFYTSDSLEDALRIWKKISTAECIEYLLYQLQKLEFDFKPGEKTYSLFNALLEDFSVSQIYAIIWKGIRDSSRLYLERKFSRKQAANSVISICQKYAENIKLNGWEVSAFSRIRDLPQSELSMYFFNQVVKIGDRGFNHPPNIKDITPIVEEMNEEGTVGLR